MIENVLQKLVDVKLKAFSPNPGDIGDIYNCYDWDDIFEELKAIKVDCKTLVDTKINKYLVKKAVTDSPEMEKLLGRYKKALVAGLIDPLYADLIDSRDQAEYALEDEKAELAEREEQKKYDDLRRSAISKIKQIGLTKDEKEVMGIHE